MTCLGIFWVEWLCRKVTYYSCATFDHENLGVIWVITPSQMLYCKAGYIFLSSEKAQRGLGNQCLCVGLLAFVDFLNVVTMQYKFLSRVFLFFLSKPPLCATSVWCEAAKKGAQVPALPGVSGSSPLRLLKPAYIWHVTAEVPLHPRSVFWKSMVTFFMINFKAIAQINL